MARNTTTHQRDIQAQAIYRYLASTGMFSTEFLSKVITANFFVGNYISQMKILRRDYEEGPESLEYEETCMLYRLCFDQSHQPRPFDTHLISLISNIQHRESDE